jgi:PPOX class probable F420-dependent enzyme
VRCRDAGSGLLRDNREVRLSEDDARARLSAARVARLATTGADGQPHLVPVTFAADGDLICVAVDHKPKTTVNLRRLRNIAENPRVAVLADHYAEDWTALWWVRADGRARVTSNPQTMERPLDLLAARYAQYRENRPDGPVIIIEVERWTGWTGGPAVPPDGERTASD